MIFNTFLLLISAILFFAVAFSFAGYLTARSERVFKPVSNAPGLCYDEIDNGQATENEYICGPEMTEEGKMKAADDNGLALFEHNQRIMAEKISMQSMAWIILFIGFSLALVSIIAAIVYWNHNRA